VKKPKRPMPHLQRKWDMDYLRARCTEEGECLLWDGALNSAGHPTASIAGKATLVRRFAYASIYGKQLPPGRRLVSLCGNPRCCAENCLRSKTVSEVLKLAYAVWKRNDPGYTQAMQRRCAPIAKLSLAKAEAIRASGKRYQDVAAEEGISLECARRVILGTAWRSSTVNSSVFNYRP